MQDLKMFKVIMMQGNICMIQEYSGQDLLKMLLLKIQQWNMQKIMPKAEKIQQKLLIKMIQNLKNLMKYTKKLKIFKLKRI